MGGAARRAPRSQRRGGLHRPDACRRRGFPAFIVNPSASTPNQVYKVQVGRYDDSERGRPRRQAPREGREVQPLDFALALLSGALLALSFPKFGTPACAWFALTPLLVALARHAPTSAPVPPRVPPRPRWLAPSASPGTLYWLVETMTTFGEPAAGRWRSSRPDCWSPTWRSFPPPSPSSSCDCTARSVPLRCSSPPRPGWRRELGRQYVWDGFPWELLGYSQVTWLPIAQMASLAGVYGLSGLLALSVGGGGVLLVHGSAVSRDPGSSPAATALLVAGRTLWGSRRLGRHRELTSAGDAVRVGRAAGQHRAGAEVGSGARRGDLEPLPGDDAPGDRGGRHVRALARVGDTISSSSQDIGARRAPSGACAVEGAWRRCWSAATRSSRSWPVPLGKPRADATTTRRSW